MKLITNNSQTWTDEYLIMCTENRDRFSQGWATNSEDWMDIRKVTSHIIIVGMWIISFTLLATFRLTAFDWYGFCFLQNGYTSNNPKVN